MLLLLQCMMILAFTSKRRVVVGLGAKLRSEVRSLDPLKSAYSSETGWQADFAAYREAFSDLDMSATQWRLLEEMTARLYDWNSKINLVSRRDIDNLVPAHIVPCMTMAKVRRFEANERVIDIGTGGGLPGLPMAILCPDAEFTLLDSVGKKLLVVEDIRQALRLDNVKVVNDRAEKFAETPGNSFDFLMGRAVSNLPHFLTFSCGLINDKSACPDSGLLYLKGGEFQKEIDDAGINVGNYQMHNVEDLVGLDSEVFDSDKKILRVDASEIIDFRGRKESVINWLADKKKKEKAERKVKESESE